MKLFRQTFRAMAAEHEIQLAAADLARARRAADAAIADVRRIEAKYSRYRDDSVTTRINRAAGGAAVAIDAETAALLRYADQCHAQSGGLFDITSGVLRRAWDFKREPPALPDCRGARRRRRAGRLADGRMGRAFDPPAARRHGNRLRRHRQGIRGRSRRHDLPRARDAARPRQSGRRHSRDRPAGGRHAVARRHPPSAAAGRGGRRASTSPPARSPPAATTSAISRSAAQRYCHILNPTTGMPVDALAIGQRRVAAVRGRRQLRDDRDAARSRARRRSSRRRTRSSGSASRATARCTVTRSQHARALSREGRQRNRDGVGSRLRRRAHGDADRPVAFRDPPSASICAADGEIGREAVVGRRALPLLYMR